MSRFARQKKEHRFRYSDNKFGTKSNALRVKAVSPSGRIKTNCQGLIYYISLTLCQEK